MKIIDYHQPLQEDQVYHIYNHGNNIDKIFYDAWDYHAFLHRMKKYLSPVIHLYAYALLPDHFHMLVNIKREEEIPFPKEMNCLSEVVSNQFRKFFISYSKCINRQENRLGSLFLKNFKRKPVDNERYLTALVAYIHHNAAHHHLVKDFRKYPYCSYREILSEKSHWLQKEEVISWFGNKKTFINFHAEQHSSPPLMDLLFEEEYSTQRHIGGQFLEEQVLVQ